MDAGFRHIVTPQRERTITRTEIGICAMWTGGGPTRDSGQTHVRAFARACYFSLLLLCVSASRSGSASAILRTRLGTCSRPSTEDTRLSLLCVHFCDTRWICWMAMVWPWRGGAHWRVRHGRWGRGRAGCRPSLVSRVVSVPASTCRVCKKKKLTALWAIKLYK